MSPFDFSDYRSFLQAFVQAKRGERGYLGQLARVMEVHSSYLTRILQEQVHLTPDQAAKLCEHWNLSHLETEFFLNQVDLERAGSKVLKEILSRRLETLRTQNEDLTHRFSDAEVARGESNGVYYSAWYYSAIHLLLMVPGHTRVKQISERLKLQEEIVQGALVALSALGLAEEKKGAWKPLHSNIHMANQTIWASIHHSNWRQYAIQKLIMRDPEAICFTGVHCMSQRDFRKVKQIFLKALEETKKVVGPSAEEEVYFITLDVNRI